MATPNAYAISFGALHFKYKNAQEETERILFIFRVLFFCSVTFFIIYLMFVLV